MARVEGERGVGAAAIRFTPAAIVGQRPLPPHRMFHHRVERQVHARRLGEQHRIGEQRLARIGALPAVISSHEQQRGDRQSRDEPIRPATRRGGVISDHAPVEPKRDLRRVAQARAGRMGELLLEQPGSSAKQEPKPGQAHVHGQVEYQLRLRGPHGWRDQAAHRDQHAKPHCPTATHPCSRTS